MTFFDGSIEAADQLLDRLSTLAKNVKLSEHLIPGAANELGEAARTIKTVRDRMIATNHDIDRHEKARRP